MPVRQRFFNKLLGPDQTINMHDLKTSPMAGAKTLFSFYEIVRISRQETLPSHIPSLNGLRAISILFVLVAHLTGTRNFPAIFQPLWILGSFGVSVFFVISGFLITTLLLKELNSTGGISLKGFYLRRIFRILPAYYGYIGIIWLLSLTGLIAFESGDLLHANTYTMNYHPHHSWFVAHIWSLSVEEQFYILWPAALLVAGPSKAFKVAAGVILTVPIIRTAMWMWVPSHRVGIGAEFQTVADALAFGCLLAGARGWLATQPLYTKFLSSRLFVLVPIIALLAHVSQEYPRVSLLFGRSLMSLAIAVSIDRFVRFPSGWFYALLNSRSFEFLGILSYSLYLWQQFFLNRYSSWFGTAFPYNLLFALSAALCSYYLVEQPFLRLKRRFEVLAGQRVIRNSLNSSLTTSLSPLSD